MAERRESCHRRVSIKELSSQGSSKLEKLHKIEKEKRRGQRKKLQQNLKGEQMGKKAKFG